MTHARDLATTLWTAMMALAIGATGCAAGNGNSSDEASAAATVPSTSTGGGGGGGHGGSGGSGGNPFAPCTEDCSKINTPPCLISVCNKGDFAGPVGTCVDVDGPAGSKCDDKDF